MTTDQEAWASLQSHRVWVDYSLPLRKSVFAATDMCGEHFTAETKLTSGGTGQAWIEIAPLYLARTITVKNIRRMVRRHGYRFATVEELLAFTHVKWYLPVSAAVVALGSIWIDEKGYRRCPVLEQEDDQLRFDMELADGPFDEHIHFALVRL